MEPWFKPTPIPDIPSTHRVSQVSPGIDHMLILVKSRAGSSRRKSTQQFGITPEMLAETKNRVSFTNAPMLSNKADQITKRARLVDSRSLDETTPVDAVVYVWGVPRKHNGMLGLEAQTNAGTPTPIHALSTDALKSSVCWVHTSECASVAVAGMSPCWSECAVAVVDATDLISR